MLFECDLCILRCKATGELMGTSIVPFYIVQKNIIALEKTKSLDIVKLFLHLCKENLLIIITKLDSNEIRKSL